MAQLVDTSAGQFDRLPPHSIEAEMCLIGSMMLDRSTIPSARAMVDKDSFFSADHQIIFESLCALHDKGRAVDVLLVREDLIRRGVYEDVGGREYLAQIVNTVPSAAHAAHYAEIVREKSTLREAIRLANAVLVSAYSPTREIGKAEEILNGMAKDAMKVISKGSSDKVDLIGTITAGIVDELCKPKEDKVARYVPTGIKSLDEVLGGLPLCGNTIIAGEAGAGKSALTKVILDSISRRKVPVGIVSIEEQKTKIGENLLALHSGVSNSRIHQQSLAQNEFDEVVQAGARIADNPLHVVDTARSLSRVCAMANILALKYHCKAVAVDHLHLVDAEAGRGVSREQEVARISAALKMTWKELGVAGICLSQLNRSEGSGKRPTLNSLRDSGALGADADVVIFIFREDFWERDTSKHTNILEVIIAKNKDGACGTVKLYYDPARYLIRELESHENQEVPDGY